MTPEELTEVTKLVAALQAAYNHLDWTGYGDSYERECAREGKLEQEIEGALKSGNALIGKVWKP